jgi:CheB methylesterase
MRPTCLYAGRQAETTKHRALCRPPNSPRVALQGQRLFEFTAPWRSLDASHPPQADLFPFDPCWRIRWINYFPLLASAPPREAWKRSNTCSRPCRPSPAWPLSLSPISPPGGKACCRKFWHTTRACRCWSRNTTASSAAIIFMWRRPIASSKSRRGDCAFGPSPTAASARRSIRSSPRWPPDHGEYAIGIVLSGAGSDGTLGVKAIKEHGGLTLAQTTDHSGPRHASMPESAIASGLVDVAVPVETMPEQLVAYVRSFDILDKEADKDERAEATRKAICAPPARPDRPRLQRLQDCHVLSPDRTPDAGSAASFARGLRRPAAPGPRRGRHAVSRPADRGHQFFPRHQGIRGAGAVGDAAPVRRQGPLGYHPRVGAGLRHRRRGLLARNHAARAVRKKPLACENPDLRHRYRRGGASGGQERPLSRYPAAGRIEGAARALLRLRGYQLYHQQADPRHVRVLLPQRGA